MKKILKSTAVFCAILLSGFTAYAQVDLSGTASVNVTSDTAANAKLMAFNEARRQVATDVLSKYSDADSFNELMKNTDDASLVKLVSSTSIDSERLSTTTYSANIKISLDLDASKKFLDENSVNNWLNDGDEQITDKSSIIIDITDGLRDWILLNREVQSAKIQMEVKKISGDSIIVLVPENSRSSLIAIIRNLGWKYSDANGNMHIWK